MRAKSASPRVRAIGWFVKPIDLDKRDPLYDMRVVLELASVLRQCVRSANPPQFQAFKDPGWRGLTSG